MSGAEAGLSPGYGLALVAETTTKRLLSAECCAVPGNKARLCDFMLLFVMILLVELSVKRLLSAERCAVPLQHRTASVFPCSNH